MTAIDQLLANNETSAIASANGDLPMPPGKKVAIVACMDALESFTDVDDDVRQSIARIRANAFLAHTDRVRGFVDEVKTGRLREVS
jgi:carbonic anhydrase